MIRYTRWTVGEDGVLTADILSSEFKVTADPTAGVAGLNEHTMSPDEARLIGVRLIEAASLADAHRSLRTY